MRFPFPHRRAAAPSYGITTAEGSHLSDIAKRQRQYVATMGFRIVAILVVVLVPGLTLLERVVLGLVATVIPYVAVIRANSGPDQDTPPTNLMLGGPRQGELPGPDRSLPDAHRVEQEQGQAGEGARVVDGEPEGEDSATGEGNC